MDCHHGPAEHDPSRLDDGIHLMKVCDIPARIGV
jgi:hypothetical protein